MSDYVLLLRGINVGGRNSVPMPRLRAALESDGHAAVRTYIQSGNVLLRSELGAAAVARRTEALLQRSFRLDSELVRVLALARDSYARVVEEAPDGFGADPDAQRYNVVFLIGLDVDAVFDQFEGHPDVDRVWPGPGVVYFASARAGATRSRLGRITQRPVYASVTIRNWNTTRRLLAMLDERAE